MGNSASCMTCEQVRNFDLVGYLDQLGISPKKISGNNFWYLSPFRPERTASFKVNRKINRWYDFGDRTSGNLLDFAIRYHQCTIGELFSMLTSTSPLPGHAPAALPDHPDNPVIILKEGRLCTYALEKYLYIRRIPVELAEQFCCEVHYQVNGKPYYGIGFKNDKGGFEIRNPYFKGSSSPKWYTTIDHGATELYVFEGFIDFLSFLVICPEVKGNFLVLNSLSFFEQARPFMEQHQVIHLYLDRDGAGRKFIQYASSITDRYQDQSELYQNHKDLNDFLCFYGNHHAGK